MKRQELEQWTITNLEPEYYLPTVIEQFLLDRKVQNLSQGTLYFYKMKLRLFALFCESQQVKEITQVDSSLLRNYLLWLEATGHNPGGIHAAYRALKALIHWWELENEPVSWTDPTKKVKSPRLQTEPLDPISTDHVQLLIQTCIGGLLGLRDKALIYFLLDTGCRANETISIRIQDINLSDGSVKIKQGKGRKFRIVFLGKRSRKALRAYIAARSDNSSFLWVSKDGEPLTYWGLRSMLARRAKAIGIESPEIHAFRRAFALTMLRSGTDIYTIQRLLGHADLQVLRRYLAQTSEDLRIAHMRASPVDQWNL